MFHVKHFTLTRKMLKKEGGYGIIKINEVQKPDGFCSDVFIEPHRCGTFCALRLWYNKKADVFLRRLGLRCHKRGSEG